MSLCTRRSQTLVSQTLDIGLLILEIEVQGYGEGPVTVILFLSLWHFLILRGGIKICM